MTDQIMETSPDIGEIAKALPKAQAAMGDVFKNANNPAFKSKYADLAAVIEAVLPALNANGISLLQPVSFDGEGVNVATMLLHESGQWVRCVLTLPLSKRDAHGIGSAVTYGKRYGLQSMSGVAPEDDDGAAAVAKGPASNNARKDFGPSSLADDFPGSDGQKGKTAHAAKKDGTSDRFKEIREELWGCESLLSCSAWKAAHLEEVKAWPETWRRQLNEDLEKQRDAVRRQMEADGDDFPDSGEASLAGADRELAPVQ